MSVKNRSVERCLRCKAICHETHRLVKRGPDPKLEHYIRIQSGQIAQSQIGVVQVPYDVGVNNVEPVDTGLTGSNPESLTAGANRYRYTLSKWAASWYISLNGSAN